MEEYKDTNAQITKCTIKALFNGMEFTSMLLELTDDSDVTKIVKMLSDNGTNDLNQLKFPLSDNQFIIFSKKQLESTLFIITVYDDKPVTKTKTIKKQK